MDALYIIITFCLIVCGIFLVIFCLIVCGMFFYYIYSEITGIKELKKKGGKEILWSKEIISLNRQQKIDGFRFIIGLDIKQYSTYIMYEKLGDNKYRILEVNASDVEIIEDDNKKPRIEEIRYINKDEDGFESIEYKKIMYVPVGTIIKEYKI